MPLVTLTSDFGSKDHFVPALKGHLHHSINELNIVDVTHDIEAHDIVEAAYIVQNVYPSFPKGSLHICYVKNHEPRQNIVFTKVDGSYFIAPNNGFFSLLFKEKQLSFFTPRANVFMPFRELAELVSDLASGKPLEEIGIPEENMIELVGLAPIVTSSQIRGSVIHVDRYENLVLNVDNGLFHEVGKGRPFKVFYKRTNPITRISEHYSDGEVGEPICLFNSNGDLVLAVCMGCAARDLEVRKDDTIQIQFV